MDISSLVAKPPKNMISRIQFDAFLYSSFNQAYDRCHRDFQKEGLEKPLSHYYINSSHNSYLTGDQYKSSSSVQMYLEAMQRGCVCLEIDTWDGYLDKDEDKTPVPIVYHGYTMTSKIRFSDIIKCVNGFINTYPQTYPIILSFENHCSRPYNEVIARTLKDVLGNKLYKPDVNTDFSGKIRSPASMRGKVVVKGKRPPEPDEIDLTLEDIVDQYDKISIRKAEEFLENERDQAKKLFDRIAPELADITLLHGVKHKSFEQSLEQENFYMHAISEGKHSKMLRESAETPLLWRRYNVNHMTRTYPKASRLDSSNYNPMISLAMGCQMVALNFQTKSTSMMLNDGLFLSNDRCGYVLKPDWLTNTKKCFFEGKPLRLSIKILRGSCLPKPKNEKDSRIINPRVKVTLHDVDIAIDNANHTSIESEGKLDRYAAALKKTYSTEATKNNGYCPVWKEHDWEFNVLNKDIAILHLRVVSDDSSRSKMGKISSQHLADAAIPVRFLSQGYRHVKLYGRFGESGAAYDFSSLLIKVKIDIA